MAHILVVGNNETLITSNSDPIHPTIFLVHGYMTNVEWSPQWRNSVRTNPVDVHIIGHGIGAHIAGFAEKNIKVGRITGLDPAVAYFKNVPSNLCLDKSDAYFVDVIHTDIENAGSSGLGTSEIIGHVDFFPNNGNDQPNCRLQSSDLIKDYNSVNNSFETYIAYIA
ncbi:pancreatic lipase-related protein 2-like [Centruroides vittatus]|uniref:pancreatic lipase-related protein 2-like n=1 Tax=Centruroides vittatus TaxID=120091 RepID=UPI003510A5ED